MKALAVAIIIAAAVIAAAPSRARADDKRSDKLTDKHTVAVLGVLPKEPALARAAGAINAVIRTQAGAKTSEYAVTGTAKQIDAAVLAGECSTIDTHCAAKLGAALGSEFTISGELERRGTHQELVLALVDVRTKQRVRSVHQTTASNGDVKKLARTAYSRLVGGDLGDLAIEANAQQGEVLIDGQVVAGLFEGKTRITGLVKGSHLLGIRAKGYKPFAVDVTIESETQQMLLLDPE